MSKKQYVIIDCDLREVSIDDFIVLEKMKASLCGCFNYYSAKEANHILDGICKRSKIVIPFFTQNYFFKHFLLDDEKRCFIDLSDDLPF